MAVHEILSPLPGTFYRRPAPDAPVFKEEGDIVSVGDVIGLVEVMKMFSEVRSEVAGNLQRFTVDTDPGVVEAGQVVALIEN